MPKVACPAANLADDVDADLIDDDTRSMHKLMSYPDPKNVSYFDSSSAHEIFMLNFGFYYNCLEVCSFWRYWSGISIALGMRLLWGLSPCVDEGKGRGDGVKQLSCSLGFYNDERLIWKIFAACGKSERNFSSSCCCYCCLPLLGVIGVGCVRCSPMITKLSFTWGIGACHFLLMAPLSKPEFFQKLIKMIARREQIILNQLRPHLFKLSSPFFWPSPKATKCCRHFPFSTFHPPSLSLSLLPLSLFVCILP